MHAHQLLSERTGLPCGCKGGGEEEEEEEEEEPRICGTNRKQKLGKPVVAVGINWRIDCFLNLPIAD